jgi:uncharacterized protein YggE
MRKSIIKTKVIACLLAALMAGLVLAQPLLAAEASAPTITVNGVGAVTIMPDVAYVHLGVNTDDLDPGQALARNNVLISTVIERLIALGIAEDDIRTDHFFMHTNWDHRTGMESGYRVSNNLTVTVRNLDMVGDVLGTAVAAGANASGGVTFGLLDSSAAYNEALALAIFNAQDRAQAIAQALNRPIDDLVSVVEIGGSHFWTAQRAGTALAAAQMEADMSAIIEPGELTITANVQMTFSVR